MDIHRSRFVPYPTPSINALAFSRSSDKGLVTPKPALKLAIGRSDGSIEIWNPDKGVWAQESTFPGGANQSIDGLAWTQEPDDVDFEGKRLVGDLRLFSTGSTATVTEWDLATGRPLRTSTGNFSDVWCLAAQPAWNEVKANTAANGTTDGQYRGQNLVAGCGDGSLVVLSTADNDLTFQRFLARSSSRKARCMSIAWQNRDRVLAGFSDGNIRVLDARNGSLLRNMSLGSGVPGAPRDTLVWRIKCLPNGDIVSADSNGEVRFWDGRMYSLIQRVSGHESDVLDIVTSSDGQTVFSGGMDGRLAVYKLGARAGERRRWAKVSHRRMHQADIKSLAVYDSKALSVVVSGGLDTAPVVSPLRSHGKEYFRRLSGLPQNPPCISAPSARLMVSWWGQDIYVWRIEQRSEDLISQDDRSRKLVSRIAIAGTEDIVSVAISQDGRLLLAATLEETRYFELRASKDSIDGRIRVRKVHSQAHSESAQEEGSKIVAISADGHWVARVTASNEVVVRRIAAPASDSDQPTEIISGFSELDRQHRHRNHQTGLRGYDRNITRLAFSPDSSVLVASDVAGYLDSWVLEGHYDSTAKARDAIPRDSPANSGSESSSSDTDSDSDSDESDDGIVIYYGQHWATNPAGHLLPKLDSAALVLTFRPSAHPQTRLSNGNPGVHATRNNPHAHSHSLPTTPSNLLVITSHHQVYEFDILAGKLSDWSRRNPTSSLPAEFRGIKDRVMGAAWDTVHDETAVPDDQRQRVWLYGASWLAMLDVSQDFEPSATAEASVQNGVAALERVNNAQQSTALLSSGKKRRRDSQAEADELSKRVKGSSGAGDRVKASERGGLPVSVRRTDGRDGSDGQQHVVEMDIDGHSEPGDAEDEDDEEDDDEEKANTSIGSIRDVDMDDDEGDSERDETGPPSSPPPPQLPQRRKWWCTYKYRPILGMVPIGVQKEHDGDVGAKEGEEGASGNEPLEIVLVERPVWDLPQIQELGQA